MIRRGVLSVLPACVAAGLALTQPARAATPEEAKAMAERAAAHIREVGEAQAFADFTRPDGGFTQGELYVFCYDQDGVNRAHGANPLFVGKNLERLTDPDGKPLIANIVTIGFQQGQGWVDYKWPDPVTRKIEPKSSYVIHTNDVVCGVGYYKH